MVRYLFYTIGDLTYQSPLVYAPHWALHTEKAGDASRVMLAINDNDKLTKVYYISFSLKGI